MTEYMRKRVGGGRSGRPESARRDEGPHHDEHDSGRPQSARRDEGPHHDERSGPAGATTTTTTSFCDLKQKQLSATDILALATMKNAAKCDT